MTLDAAVIGRRIVVRHETGGVGVSGGPEMSDVIGHVTAVDATSVTLELRDGRTADVALSTIVAWKPVPERPLRRRRALSIDADELTRITSLGWPAIESVALGEWELRASGRFTGRANSVATTGSPGVPFDQALQEVEGFYAARSLPAQAQVIVGSSHERSFSDAGWVRKDGYYGGAVVQVADLEPAYEADPAARISPRADDEWLAHYGRVDDPASARAVMEAPSRVGFVSIGGPVLAIGRVVVIGEWAGLSAVEVVPSARRQGLARRIVETSLAWAVEHGADKAYLQTMRTNTAALALYEPYGFTDHHDYVYLQPPAPVR
ncbi:GNAT family N-acetyltransferase [Aeromicrobium sp. SMF47]|uniref:GNAT family N-acetyltransferase n=1 Tax=Aeromicrobium TaxID=2040 RepID=UPI00129E3058|nr:MULTISPECIES: GNAT family N-acetyltransferase [Aeromicrobium]MRJ76638.1 GNAT family N-acetyltransferase [Aeromicrobium yanjiei]MRK00985.1 GNAT family N-acetyltransferase [Aeromicrobium sp. S22]